MAPPDTERFGGLSQMKKLAAIAEAHSVMMAPHDGSIGPVAVMAAVHLIATHGKRARWMDGGGV